MNYFQLLLRWCESFAIWTLFEYRSIGSSLPSDLASRAQRMDEPVDVNGEERIWRALATGVHDSCIFTLAGWGYRITQLRTCDPCRRATAFVVLRDGFGAGPKFTRSYTQYRRVVPVSPSGFSVNNWNVSGIISRGFQTYSEALAYVRGAGWQELPPECRRD